MKILIGTPIHECKDYATERWLENVSKLQRQTVADLFLVDNSTSTDYVEKLKKYCAKYGIKNYKIEHFEVTNNDPSNARSQKVEIAQEMIRREALKGEYDAWFSWECDQIIPTNALNELIRIMKSENCMMVVHNSWSRTNPTDLNTNMGCTLIGREALQKGWFLPDKDGQISFDLSDCYNVDETMFKKRVLKNGGNYIEAYGIINPIYHLNN